MKPRTVMVTVEVQTALTLAGVKQEVRTLLAESVEIDVRQVQVSVQQPAQAGE